MLSVSNLVNVSINLSPLAAATRSFGVLMVVGDTPVIGADERFRTYTTITDVANDFGTSAPEYLAAALYFGQTPKPSTLMVGRWFRTAIAGQLNGGILSPSQQALANFTVITNGGFKVMVDGSLKTVGSLNFSGASNLNGVASIINTALSGAVVTWNGSQFVITSSTTGTSSLVAFAIAPSTGTDISTLLQLTSGLAIDTVPGFAAETPAACAAVLANLSSAWYGLTFAASVQPVDADNLAVSTFIEALDITRIFGVTITNTNVLSSEVTTDLASLMKAAAYRQSFCQYSSSSPYAICSAFGRAFSVNFAANRSTITLMYKQEPGVTAENLDANTANVLKAKRCNVFTAYVNGTMILQYGVMSGPAFFDEIHGLDWFQDSVQTACYNVLYQSTTKVPQTDAGVNQLSNAIAGVCDSAVNNGLVAPGTWNADGFGQLATGQFLKTGYYIYAQPMALQSQSDRETRVAPPIQVAIKLAGAIQSLNVLVNVNR